MNTPEPPLSPPDVIAGTDPCAECAVRQRADEYYEATPAVRRCLQALISSWYLPPQRPRPLPGSDAWADVEEACAAFGLNPRTGDVLREEVSG